MKNPSIKETAASAVSNDEKTKEDYIREFEKLNTESEDYKELKKLINMDEARKIFGLSGPDNTWRLHRFNDFPKINRIARALRTQIYGNRKALYRHDPRHRALIPDERTKELIGRIQQKLSEGCWIHSIDGAYGGGRKHLRVWISDPKNTEDSERVTGFVIIPLVHFCYEDYDVPEQELRELLIPAYERFNEDHGFGQCEPGFVEDLLDF